MMTWNNRRGGVIRVAVVALSVLAAGGEVEALEVPRTWDDEGPTHNWTDDDNWDPSTAGGPRNVGTLDFIVTVPADYDSIVFNAAFCVGGTQDGELCLDDLGRQACVDGGGDCLSQVEITDFFLGDNSRLALDPDTNLFVLRNAEIAGIIDAQGGNFTSVADAAFTGCRARVYASDGSRIQIAAPDYCSTGLWRVAALGGTFEWDLFTADGSETSLDLSSISVFNCGFQDGANGSHNYQHVRVSGGATIDLSGVHTVTGPARHDDYLKFTVNGSGSALDFGSLIEVAANGSGWTDLNVTEASLSLPLLESIDGAHISVVNGQLDLPLVEVLSNTALNASNLATVTAAGANPSTYSWRRYRTAGLGGTFEWDLISADGNGTSVNLSSISTLDCEFDDGAFPSHNYVHVRVGGGATINLSGVQVVKGPARRDDKLMFAVDGAGSELNMAALQTIWSHERDAVNVSIADGGHMWMGDVSFPLPSIEPTIALDIKLNTDSVLSVGSLEAYRPVVITLETATDMLEAFGSLRLGSDINITAPAGGTVRVGGDFLYEHEETANLSLGLATLEFVGDRQWLEVGGTDIGEFVQLLPDKNFGYQQLVIGGLDHASVVGLVDRHDNLEPGVPDALYLWGVEDNEGVGGVEGLRMLHGSTLVIGYLNVYALLDLDGDGVMEWKSIHELFDPGATRYHFNHNGNDGWLVRPEVIPPIDARQPFNPDGSNETGWTAIDVVALGDPPPVPGTDEFEIEVTGGTAPTIVGTQAGSYKVTVELDRPIPVGERTRVTHVPSGSKTCVGYLPGDVNGDNLSNASDINNLINCLNDVDHCGMWQADVNRSGVANASDILRVIDLLNGAGEYDVWLAGTLPGCP